MQNINTTLKTNIVLIYATCRSVSCEGMEHDVKVNVPYDDSYTLSLVLSLWCQWLIQNAEWTSEKCVSHQGKFRKLLFKSVAVSRVKLWILCFDCFMPHRPNILYRYGCYGCSGLHFFHIFLDLLRSKGVWLSCCENIRQLFQNSEVPSPKLHLLNLNLKKKYFSNVLILINKSSTHDLWLILKAHASLNME